MMIEQATVISYQQGIATVQCQTKSGCGSCGAKSECGSRVLSTLTGEKRSPHFTLTVHQPLTIGDTIEIGLDERHLLLSVFLLYCLPLCSVLISTLLFSQWIENELFLALSILGSTLCTFNVIRRKISSTLQENFTPVFLRKI